MKAKFTGSAIMLAVVLFTCGALASIEREPLRVNRNNFGPKYDIDDLERTRVLAESNQETSNPAASAPRPAENTGNNPNPDDNSHQDAPMISIRRIFLVPVMPSSSSSDESGDQPPSDPMRMFGMPPRSIFSPFSTRHLFGGDEASRPRPVVNPDESQERPSVSAPAAKPELEGSRPISAMFDPVEMLMEAMRQALNPANMLPPPTAEESTDLNKEASGENKPASSEASETGLVDKKPKSFNSTKEDIVEIDGKKYLRKTVINRHVGDGIMFMTRRLIFSPLNETETVPPITEGKSESSTSGTTEAPSTEQPSGAKKIDQPADNSSAASSPAASEPSSAKEPVATEAPASPAEPSSTTVANDREDTTKSLGDKIADTVAKVERLMDKEEPASTPTSTTDKPIA